MVGCDSGQGRSEVETRRRSLESQASVAALRRGFQPSENAGLGRKMPFMDGHLLAQFDRDVSMVSKKRKAFFRYKNIARHA
jgi:hypothetical protein